MRLLYQTHLCKWAKKGSKHNTYIKESKIEGAGRGVFATKGFECGSFVCVYDGANINAKSAKTFEQTYAIEHPRKRTLVRLGTPKERWCCNNAIGQFVNDGAALDLFSGNSKELTLGKARDRIRMYYELSLSRQNVSLKRCKDPNREEVEWGMWAIKDIRKDEELYMCYSHGYWIYHFCQNRVMTSREILLKALVMDPPLLSATCRSLSGDNLKLCVVSPKKRRIESENDARRVWKRIFGESLQCEEGKFFERLSRMTKEIVCQQDVDEDGSTEARKESIEEV